MQIFKFDVSAYGTVRNKTTEITELYVRHSRKRGKMFEFMQS